MHLITQISLLCVLPSDSVACFRPTTSDSNVSIIKSNEDIFHGDHLRPVILSHNWFILLSIFNDSIVQFFTHSIMSDQKLRSWLILQYSNRFNATRSIKLYFPSIYCWGHQERLCSIFSYLHSFVTGSSRRISIHVSSSHHFSETFWNQSLYFRNIYSRANPIF